MSCGYPASLRRGGNARRLWPITPDGGRCPPYGTCKLSSIDHGLRSNRRDFPPSSSPSHPKSLPPSKALTPAKYLSKSSLHCDSGGVLPGKFLSPADLTLLPTHSSSTDHCVPSARRAGAG